MELFTIKRGRGGASVGQITENERMTFSSMQQIAAYSLNTANKELFNNKLTIAEAYPHTSVDKRQKSFTV